MVNTAKQSANSDCAQVGSRPNLCSHLSQTIFFFCVSQLRGGANGQLFSLSNSANTKTISEGITQRGSEVIYRSFSSIPNDIYYWVLPQSFKGDKVKEKRKEKKQSREQARGTNCEVFAKLDFPALSVPLSRASTCCQVKRLHLSTQQDSFEPLA